MIVTIVQARCASTRLPRKVLADVSGQPLLHHVVERSRAIAGVDEVVVATSDLPADDELAALCRDRGWAVFRGSEGDVLDRYVRAARLWRADHVVRVTADCPLVCPRQGSRVVARHALGAADYSHNVTVFGSGMPLGTGVEVFTREALERSWREDLTPANREHVDVYISENPDLFPAAVVPAPEALRHPEFRLTVDTPQDLALVRAVYTDLWSGRGVIDLEEVLGYLIKHPSVAGINSHVVQKLV